MKFTIIQTSRFKKDVKRAARRGWNLSLLRTVIAKLADGQSLPPSCRDHALSGPYAGFRECHVKPDWLLVYSIDNNVLLLTLAWTGTHADLFGL